MNTARPRIRGILAPAHFCAMGLLERFVINGGKRERCVHLLARVLTPYCEGSTIRSNRSPVSYNDMSGRTVGEIIQMFRCASYLPDVTEREPHEMLEQLQWKSQQYTDALNDAMKVPDVKTPDWLKFGDVIMSGSAAKLGLAPSKSWGKIMEEIRDAMAA